MGNFFNSKGEEEFQHWEKARHNRWEKCIYVDEDCVGNVFSLVGSGLIINELRFFLSTSVMSKLLVTCTNKFFLELVG